MCLAVVQDPPLTANIKSCETEWINYSHGMSGAFLSHQLQGFSEILLGKELKDDNPYPILVVVDANQGLLVLVIS